MQLHMCIHWSMHPCSCATCALARKLGRQCNLCPYDDLLMSSFRKILTALLALSLAFSHPLTVLAAQTCWTYWHGRTADSLSLTLSHSFIPLSDLLDLVARPYVDPATYLQPIGEWKDVYWLEDAGSSFYGSFFSYGEAAQAPARKSTGNGTGASSPDGVHGGGGSSSSGGSPPPPSSSSSPSSVFEERKAIRLAIDEYIKSDAYRERARCVLFVGWDPFSLWPHGGPMGSRSCHGGSPPSGLPSGLTNLPSHPPHKGVCSWRT